MKKIILILTLTVGTIQFSFARKIIIDVSGSGSVSQSGGHYEFNCSGSEGCCGTLEIEIGDRLSNEPSVGDPTVVEETDFDRFNVIHRWTGKWVSSTLSTQGSNTIGEVVLDDSIQEF